MKTLIILDIDLTICDSSSVDKYLPVAPSRDYSLWHRETMKRDFPIVPGSKRGVRAVLKRKDLLGVVLLTGRNDVMRSYTEEWIEKHFPELSTFELSMKAAADYSTSVISKTARLKKILKKYKPDRIIVIDDDAGMKVLASGKNDQFWQIKNCRWTANQV